MTISSLMKNYLERHTTGLEVEKFKILYEYLDPGENCENIKYHEPAKDKEEDQMFCLHQVFRHLHQNQGLDLNLLALTNYFFFYHG